MRAKVAPLLAAVAVLLPVAGAHAAAPNVIDGPAGRTVLTGGWTARLDPTDMGLQAGWPKGDFTGAAVSLPYVFRAPQVTGAAGILAFQGSVGWYRRRLYVPTDGRYAIRFDSLNFRGDVWIDGRHLLTHLGTYLPFEARARLKAGPHQLVVRADWRDPAAMKLAGYHRTWFNFGGLSREVTIRPLGPTEIVAPTVTTTLAPSGDALVTVTAQLRNVLDARPITLSGTLRHGDQEIPLTFPVQKIPHGAPTTLRTRVRVPHPALWQPGSPQLYDLDLAASDLDAGWHARVGLRQITYANGAIKLNDKPLTLRGASLQEDVMGRGDALRPADQDAVVAGLKGLGANATRAQHPLDEGLLERLDAAGILIIQGVGPVDAPGGWTNVTPAQQLHARERVRVTVRQAQTHPSIIAWNLANEVAGNGHPGGQAQYVEAMSAELHRRDPGRLVALDVWGAHPPAVLGPMYAGVDLIGITNYLGWYEDPLVPDARLRQLIRGRMARYRHIFAGKALVVSEFGAEANADNPTTTPGGYAFQARLLRAHLDSYRAMPGLDGELVWNLRDFGVAPSFAGGSITRAVGHPLNLVRGLNQKGLLSWDGTPKPGYASVRHELQLANAEERARGGL